MSVYIYITIIIVIIKLLLLLLWVPEDRGGSWIVATMARGLRMKLEGRNVDMQLLQATDPWKEVSRGGEEVNHDTLWYSKWKLGSKESGSQWAVGKL